MRRWLQGVGLSLAAHGLVVLGVTQLPRPTPISSTSGLPAGGPVAFRIATSDRGDAPPPSGEPPAQAEPRRPRGPSSARARARASTVPEGEVEAPASPPPDTRAAEPDAIPKDSAASKDSAVSKDSAASKDGAVSKDSAASKDGAVLEDNGAVVDADGTSGGATRPGPGTPGGRVLDLDVRPPPPPGPPGLAGLGLPPPQSTSTEPEMRGPGRFANNRVAAEIAPDGTLRLEADGRAGLGVRNGSPSLIFDPTEELMRLVGDDPVAYDKSKFEKATRGLRNELRDEACRADLERALVEVGPRLARIWRDPQRSSEARRRAIFQVWNECAEDGPPEVVAAALRIRGRVLDFIARHMPPGTAYAYSAEEIQRLNASRLGREIFAPYQR